MMPVAQDPQKGTLYLYFSTKEALFEGVLTQLLGDTVARLELSPPNPGEAASAFLKRALAPMLTDDKVSLRLIIFEGARFPELLNASTHILLSERPTA